MDHLVDYIQWMGEIPYSALPFNEADALVLCMLSYFDLAPMFPGGGQGPLPVRACQRLIDENKVRVLLVGKDRGFQKILECAVRTSRYGDLEIRDFEELNREDPPLQFAAMSFCSPDFRFVAFRGTDNTLAGWEEDFMISFTVTEAQKLAADYTARALQDERACILGGHSKGGNLALYAACTMPEESWEKVTHLYLLDGPGICPEVMDDSAIRRIDAKTTKIQPAFSVVGKLFDPVISDSRIVQSSASGFVQHSLDTWGIDHGKLLLAEGPNPRSVWINNLLDRWISGISQEDRPVFVRELFDALAADGAKSLDELDDRGIEGFEVMLAKFLCSSEVTRKTVFDLPKRAILGEYYDAIMQKGLTGWLRDSFVNWQNQILDMLPKSGSDQTGSGKT